MAYDYQCDESKRLVSITMRGPFAVLDVLNVIERQRSDGTWAFGMLVDVRLMTGVPALPELRQIATADATNGEASERRGPLAVVVTDPVLYAKACAYQTLAGSARPIEVFRDREAAEFWLAERTPKF
jgi:hypothetical protein